MNQSLEEKLRRAAFAHLTPSELVGYRDGKLDTVGLARAEAHLGMCAICEESIELLRGELAALESGQISPEDLALIKRVAGITDDSPEKAKSPGVRKPAAVPSLTVRLSEALRELVIGWQAFFGQLKPVHHGGEGGREVWRGKSKDGLFEIWAVWEETTDLSIHFSSSETELEGRRLQIGLGRIKGEIILERFSDTEVRAKFVVSKYQRPKDLSRLSVKIL
jgi:hypothetical protein